MTPAIDFQRDMQIEQKHWHLPSSYCLSLNFPSTFTTKKFGPSLNANALRSTWSAEFMLVIAGNDRKNNSVYFILFTLMPYIPKDYLKKIYIQ